MPVPPIGGEAVAAVLRFRRFDRYVVGAFQLNDVGRLADKAIVSATVSARLKLEFHLSAGILQRIEIANLCLYGREVTHCILMFGLWLESTKGGP